MYLVCMTVLTEDICEHCKQREDVIHALWLCPCFSTVWDLDSIWNFCQVKHFSKFVEPM